MSDRTAPPAPPAPPGLEAWSYSDGSTQREGSGMHGRPFWYQRRDGWCVIAVPEGKATLEFPFDLKDRPAMPDATPPARNFGVDVDRLQGEPREVLTGTSERLAEVGLGVAPGTSAGGLLDGWFDRGVRVESPLTVSIALLATLLCAFAAGKLTSHAPQR